VVYSIQLDNAIHTRLTADLLIRPLLSVFTGPALLFMDTSILHTPSPIALRLFRSILSQSTRYVSCSPLSAAALVAALGATALGATATLRLQLRHFCIRGALVVS